MPSMGEGVAGGRARQGEPGQQFQLLKLRHSSWFTPGADRRLSISVKFSRYVEKCAESLQPTINFSVCDSWQQGFTGLPEVLTGLGRDEFTLPV